MLKAYKKYIYVFFTKTGREDEAANDVRKIVSDDSITPLNYSVEVLFRKKGETHKEIRPIFPGYIFVESFLENKEFILKTQKCIKESQYIIRLLKYGDSDMAAINIEEREMLEDILQGNLCINTSLGYIKKNKLVITQGPFRGKENLIKSFNRHKRYAVAEIPIMGEERKIIVGLEIINKYLN